MSPTGVVLVHPTGHPQDGQLRERVEEFRRRCLRDDVPALRIEEIWREKDNWLNPNRHQPGVYVHYSKDGRFLYIGKASMSDTIDKRYWKTVGYDPALRPLILACMMIPMDREWAFLAPALEEFLIEELNPTVNGVGKRHAIRSATSSSPRS